MTEIFEVPIPNNDLLNKAEQLRLASIKTSQANNNDHLPYLLKILVAFLILFFLIGNQDLFIK